MEDSPNFVSHVFNFEQDGRNEMVNIMQYTVLAIIFISLLNRLVQDYIPEVDKDKGNLVIFFEISIQCIILFVGILFIHRIITFIPTASGTKYADQNVITVILPTLIVLLSISKLGEKVSILFDRFSSTPPAKPQQSQSNSPSLLPKSGSTVNPINSPEPDFNTMFSSTSNPIQSQTTETFEPMPMSSTFGSMF
jgi:hypothetical protein